MKLGSQDSQLLYKRQYLTLTLVMQFTWDGNRQDKIIN